jgi:hypothetical protein
VSRRSEAAEEVFGSKKNKKREPSQAEVLVRQAEDGVTLFHDAERRAHARVTVGKHHEVLPVRGAEFKRWLARAFYAVKKKPPSAQAMADALAVIEARAVFDGQMMETAVRVAALEGRLYLDLANDDWQVVEVGPDGWRVTDNPPVRFRRPRGVGALPVPVPGRLNDLRRLLNIAEDRDWQLVVAWLVAALRNHGPYPILSLHGQQGSAKSTTARLLRRVIDPHKVCLRSEPKEPRDLAITASNSWLVALDNLSSLPGWMSDALCRLATGGGFGTRQLYSDDEEVFFEAQRPIILNGIAAVGSRPDLLERSLLIELPTIPDERRRTEAEVYADFDAKLPGILGGLLDAVSGALRDLPAVKLDRLPRMADFARWATAAERSLGWKSGTFVIAYDEARKDAVATALDASPITEPLRRLVEGAKRWEGTSTELLQRLRELAGDAVAKTDDWPRRANVLSSQLKRLAPDLARAGISVGWSPRTKTRRTIVLEMVRDSSSPSSPSSPDPEKQGDKANRASAPSSSTSAPSSSTSTPGKAGLPDVFVVGDSDDDGDDESPQLSDRGYPAEFDEPFGGVTAADIARGAT